MATDLSSYLRNENAIRSSWASNQAANTFGRQQAQLHGSRGMEDFRQGFQRQLPQFQSGFGQRGLAGGGMQSGVMQGAMRNYLGDYTKNLGRMTQDNASNLSQYDFNARQYDTLKEQQLAENQAAKIAQIAQTAAHITALKPYMGSGM